MKKHNNSRCSQSCDIDKIDKDCTTPQKRNVLDMARKFVYVSIRPNSFRL